MANLTDKFIPGVHIPPEFVLYALPANMVAGSITAYDKSGRLNNKVMMSFSATVQIIYDPTVNSHVQIPAPTRSGTWGAGNAGYMRTISAPNGNVEISATGGSVPLGANVTINTALTIVNGKAGLGARFRVHAGVGKGAQGYVKSIVYGANAKLDLVCDTGYEFSAAPDTTTKFKIWAGSYWDITAGVIGANTFNCYDFLTNAWTARSQTNLPATIGTDSFLLACGSATGAEGAGYSAGTVLSATTTTITPTAADLTKWNASSNGANWANMQIRMTSGTQRGETKKITGYVVATGVFTFAAMAGAPAANDTFIIEGLDDSLIYGGSGAVGLIEYTPTANTWAALPAPTVARGGIPASGCCATAWIDDCDAWKESTGIAYKPHYSTTIIRQNGRYLYAFRGGASVILDVFDRAANTWINDISYGNRGSETFTGGSCSCDQDGHIHIFKENTGRRFDFDVEQNTLTQAPRTNTPQGNAAVSKRMFMTKFMDNSGNQLARWALYHAASSSNALTRTWVI